MDLIDNLIDKLKKSNKINIFVPNLINEINTFVMHKLLDVKCIYANDFNKWNLLCNLANLGLELENTIKINDDCILSLQLHFLSGIFIPIIDKIKNICVNINLVLVDEYKKKINEIITYNLDKYNIHKKNIKYIQIIPYYNNINKIIEFNNFGISIKITNYHFNNIFTDLINETNSYFQNINFYTDTKFSWIWKVDKFNKVDKNIFSDENKNIHNDDFIIYTSNVVDDTKSFKIIQMNPEIITNNMTLNKQTEKINPVIIEDDSFQIPIKNVFN